LCFCLFLHKKWNDFNKAVLYIVHKLIHLSHSYTCDNMKDVSNCEHVCYQFIGWSNHQYKFVDLDGFFNFVFDDFSIWNHLLSHNVDWSCHILQFKFWIVQTKSDWEITKIKFVDLDVLYNFVFDDFFIWNYLLSQTFNWSSYILKFKFWSVETNSYGKRTQTKVVDLDEVYSFVIGDIFIWNYLCSSI
jgi:hypothetical protein